MNKSLYLMKRIKEKMKRLNLKRSELYNWNKRKKKKNKKFSKLKKFRKKEYSTFSKLHNL